MSIDLRQKFLVLIMLQRMKYICLVTMLVFRMSADRVAILDLDAVYGFRVDLG